MAQNNAESPGSRMRVAAHLLLGACEEPFLGALCESLHGACETLIVNDNAPDPSPHADALQRSAFGRSGRLILDRTPFVDFSTARNVCLRLHREHDAGQWAAFVDADEVHAPAFARIAGNLSLVPPGVDFIDGYTWHFFASFAWYMSIERRMSFFRFSPQLRWEGRVHERLHGASGARLALPYVYAHYGWVMPPRRLAEKGRHYSSLGAPGRIVDEPQLDEVRAETYFEFEHRWGRALRFSGRHPSAARSTIARLSQERAAEFAVVDDADLRTSVAGTAGAKCACAAQLRNAVARSRAQPAGAEVARMIVCANASTSSARVAWCVIQRTSGSASSNT